MCTMIHRIPRIIRSNWKRFFIIFIWSPVIVYITLQSVHETQSWYREREIEAVQDQQTVTQFLHQYEAYCKQNVRHLSEVSTRFPTSPDQKVCDCIPDTLVGRLNVSESAKKVVSLADVEHQQRHTLSTGGHWSPSTCVARHRVAIIIPYRDREQHLIKLLSVLHSMLQRQQLDYTIFVVEQVAPQLFNKAMLMNAGFMEARSRKAFDCYIFHDVDMLPEDDRNFYVCSPTPRHVGSHLDKWNYKLIYYSIFGGVTAFTEEQFERVNGFSNHFYGWGGEDDDMSTRVRSSSMKIARFPQAVARYSMILHSADSRNPVNAKASSGFLMRSTHYSNDGLTTINFTQLSVDERPLFTKLSVALPPPPTSFRTHTRPWDPPYINVVTVGVLFLVLFLLIVCHHKWKESSAVVNSEDCYQQRIR